MFKVNGPIWVFHNNRLDDPQEIMVAIFSHSLYHNPDTWNPLSRTPSRVHSWGRIPKFLNLRILKPPKSKFRASNYISDQMERKSKKRRELVKGKYVKNQLEPILMCSLSKTAQACSGSTKFPLVSGISMGIVSSSSISSSESDQSSSSCSSMISSGLLQLAMNSDWDPSLSLTSTYMAWLGMVERQCY